VFDFLTGNQLLRGGPSGPDGSPVLGIGHPVAHVVLYTYDIMGGVIVGQSAGEEKKIFFFFPGGFFKGNDSEIYLKFLITYHTTETRIIK